MKWVWVDYFCFGKKNNSVNNSDMDNPIHNWKNNSENSSQGHGDCLAHVRGKSYGAQLSDLVIILGFSAHTFTI